MNFMKKATLFLSILISSALSSYAQPEKGDVFLGGNISAGFSNNTFAGKKTDAQGGMSVEILIGYVMDKGWVVGAGPAYRNYFDTDYDLFGNKVIRSSTHGIGPAYFVRKYTRITDKLYFRGGLTTSYTANINKARYFPSKETSDVTVNHTVDVRLRAGLAFFPHPNIGLEFSYGELGYRADFAHVRDPDNKSVSNRLVFKYGVDGLEVSISYFLRRKAKTTETR
jgi:hypothetical protein